MTERKTRWSRIVTIRKTMELISGRTTALLNLMHNREVLNDMETIALALDRILHNFENRKNEKQIFCKWTASQDGEWWKTECGGSWRSYRALTPDATRYYFCPDCGKTPQATKPTKENNDG